MTVKFRTPYDGSVVQPQVMFTEDSLTKQSFKDECDVNNIMRRYAATGVLEHVRESSATWQDVSDASSFQDAMNTVAQAESTFMSLPAAVRAAFDNDCVTFLDAFGSEEGQALLVEQGVLERDSVEPPAKERSATEPVAPPQADSGVAPPAVGATE